MEKSVNLKKVKYLGDYIDGEFILPESVSSKRYSKISPSDFNDTVFEYSVNISHVEQACLSAKKAWAGWQALSQAQREVYFLRLAKIFIKKQEEITVLISRETGKPLWESRQEAQALAKKIDITLKEGLKLVCDQKAFVAGKTKTAQVRYRSKGVMAVIGPFNFPMHLPAGWIIPALACGNTVVFKPSEQTPACGQKWAECIHLADFPKGVFNVVQGQALTSKTLIKNSYVDGVLFTGSYSVGRKIKESLLEHPWKILALEMGGKNSALVWSSADVEKAVQETIKSAYLTCGQRCSAVSRLILHNKIKDAFLKKFILLSRNLKIGHWKDNPFMGPLISEKAVVNFFKAGAEAKKEKADILIKGETIKILNGHYVSPFVVELDKFNLRSWCQNEELFAPFITVYSIENEKQAIELINHSGYGLSLSVFAEDSKDFIERIFQKAQVGVFHVNVSSAGASSYLPFGGCGKSGNHRPAGLFAVNSCVTPVAYLENRK